MKIDNLLAFNPKASITVTGLEKKNSEITTKIFTKVIQDALSKKNDMHFYTFLLMPNYIITRDERYLYSLSAEINIVTEEDIIGTQDAANMLRKALVKTNPNAKIKYSFDVKLGNNYSVDSEESSNDNK